MVRGMKSRWIMPAPLPPSYDAPIEHEHLSPIVAQILCNRGITPEELPAFLRPEVAAMHPPTLMRGVDEAVRRIHAAIAGGERIAVYGDFDVDGVTGTVLLHEIISTLGGDVCYYIPHRHTEGYGLNVEAIERLRADGVRLIVTVDCGVSCAEEVAHARAIGVDVVITDHHYPPQRLPEAVAVINPNQPLCPYPFKALAGVGVAFKLASALVEGRPDARRLRRDVLDLVVVGTVSDMVPLRGENRVLVHHGLPVLTHTARLGLRALLQRAGLDHAEVSAADIGYRVGPRLNAAGRMAHATAGCELLLTRDQATADRLADALEQKNADRQRLTAEVLEEARARVGPHPIARGLVIDDPSWPAGVIGLVAGRLADEYCRPVLVIERGEVESRGSARSVPGFNVIEALAGCADLLTKYGGHAQAAGFSLRSEAIPALRERVAALAAERLSAEDLTPFIQLDAEIGGRGFGAVALRALQEQLNELEPFGMGNQAPMLLWRNLRVADCKIVGGKHLRFSVSTPEGNVGAIAFGRADDLGVLPRGQTIDVVFNLQYNDWNGYSVVELRVKDVALKGDVARGGIDRAPQASPV